MQHKPLYIATVFVVSCSTVFLDPAFADSKAGSRSDSRTAVDEITIIGNPDAVKTQAGSAHVLTSEDLEKFEYTDIHNVLRQVPGISIREEEGYGLRPNIAIRGSGSERSSRITLMEDGILIAPAPYAAPSAYYFPTAGRLAGVEVLKGPASVKNGPYTVGGALNLLSTPIPQEDGGTLKLEAGSDRTLRLHTNYGQNGNNVDWLLETHQWRSDGFKAIDHSNGDSGFDKRDYLAKFRVHSDIDNAVYQQLELKLQHSSENSDQSYLGLTDADFGSNPYRRYAPSQMDNFDADHEQVALSYYLDLNNAFTFSATVYNNEFARNWFKTDKFNAGIGSVGYNAAIGAINNNPASADALLYQAILDGTYSDPVNVNIKDNNREYYARGIDLKFGFAFTAGNTAHDLSIGLRYHEDEEDRLQRNNAWVLEDGVLTLAAPGVWGDAGNRQQHAEAVALYLHDTIDVGSWSFTPGVRYESIDQTRQDWSDMARTIVASQRENSNHVLLPGLGVSYTVNDQWQLIAGVHKGFTPSGNSPNTDEEESINYEAGFRFDNDRANAELIAFYNDYENLLGSCTASTGSNCEPGDQFNGNGVAVRGIELLAHYSLTRGADYDMPVALTYTWTDAEFKSTFQSDFFGNVTSGDPLTYTPEHQARVSIGYVNNSGWDLYLNTTWVDEMVTALGTNSFNTTDSNLLFGLAGHYAIGKTTTLYATIENLTDEANIIARAPYGARVNRPRSFMLGIRWDL